MKKLVLFLSVCALLTSAVWVGAAGDAGDPLASLSYLNGEFSQRAEKKIDQALEQSDKELAERLKNGEVGEAAAAWQETRLKEGDTLHGVTGTGVVLSAIIGTLGYFIKPQCFILLIAVFLIEGIYALSEKHLLKPLLLSLLTVAITFSPLKPVQVFCVPTITFSLITSKASALHISG